MTTVRSEKAKIPLLAHTHPGLEGIAKEEIAAKIPSVEFVGSRIVTNRAALIIFVTSNFDKLSELRTVEDVFVLLASERIRKKSEALEIAVRAAKTTDLVSKALQLRSRFFGWQAPKGGKLIFRVVSRLLGTYPFQRRALGAAIAQAISSRSDYRWVFAEDEEANAIEFWATLLFEEFFLGLRLSDATMRHRTYLVSHRPASLRPAVAAALAWLSKPDMQDIVLDPLCGVGTILLERALLGRYRLLIGGDKSADAIAAAHANFGPRHKPRLLVRWDATSLPLRDQSVDKIITNLPWGKKLATPSELGILYPSLLREFSRVLRPQGIVVLMANPSYPIETVAKRYGLSPVRKLKVQVLGAWGAIHVLKAACDR